MTQPFSPHNLDFRIQPERAGPGRVRSSSRQGPRMVLWGAIAVLALGISCTNGDATSCSEKLACASGYECQSGACVAETETTCSAPEDCAGGESCSATGLCRAGSCYEHGCIDGYYCGVVSDLHQCVPNPDASPSDAGDAATDGPTDAPSVVSTSDDASVEAGTNEDAAPDSGGTVNDASDDDGAIDSSDGAVADGAVADGAITDATTDG